MTIRYFIVALFLVGFTTIYKINEKEVERILSALSADDMQGRTLNSEGIDKAADFISNEFKVIGLADFNEAKNYKQNFTINSSSVTEALVAINNKKLTEASFFIKLSDSKVSWNKENMPEVLFIKAEDNFRQMAGTAFGSSKDLLVIISESHKDIFSRYHSYFSQPTMAFARNEKKAANLVFSLIDMEDVSELRIEAILKVEEKRLTNVVGVIEGKKLDEIVLFAAHYDHLGIGAAVDGDSIYNGANDDASGVTAVIELARYFKSKETPERTLVFVAFTAEEVGGYGSQYFSKQLNPDEIMAMINIEMIGKQSKEGLNSAWMSGWDKSDMGYILQKNLKEIEFKFFEDPYPKQQLFYRSDNATLARLGVPAHSISTTQIDIDTDYHQPSDEIETLDITNITNTIKAIAIGSQGIIDGVQTPRRIDPEQVRD